MRPSYETSTDLGKEDAVAEMIGRLLGAEPQKLPSKYPFDRAFVQGKNVVALAEIKCRSNKRDEYPTFFMSLAKWMACIRIAEFSGVPALIVVRWSDGICAMKMPDYGLPVTFAGRSDRKDLDDMELVVEVPVKDFTPIDKFRV